MRDELDSIRKAVAKSKEKTEKKEMKQKQVKKQKHFSS
jgi:hypothetical protein